MTSQPYGCLNSLSGTMARREETMTSVEETAVICAYMEYGRLDERLGHPQPLHSASSLS